MTAPAITYPSLKSDNPHHDTGPYHLGHRGWADTFDVHVDGAMIGKLRGSGQNKRAMDYGFIAAEGSALGKALEAKWPRIVLPVGRAEAKAKVATLVAKLQEAS